MNMQNLMMQAKKMQKDIEKAQTELESKNYEGKSQMVTAVISGNIDMNDFSSDDKEIIEDMVLVAVNSAIEKMEADKADKFGKYGQMFNGLM